MYDLRRPGTAGDHRSASTAHHTAPSGTKIILADTAFGWSLAVGSGPFKNFTLYYISSDHGHSYGCTTGVTCAEISACARAWPPLYTNGFPGYSGVPGAGIGVVGLPVGPDQIT